MNKSEVARLFAVSKETIDRWVNDGKLPEPRRSLFSTRWQYEQLAGLVKFRSTPHKNAE
jgi:predicted site-specific integrase-resolvase